MAALHRTVSALCRRSSLFRDPGHLVSSAQSKRFLPILTVDTNIIDIPKNVAPEMVKLVAETLKKPSELVTVSIRGGLSIARGSDAGPTVSAHVWSVGVFDAERNPAHSKIFMEYLMKTFNLPKDRVTIIFHPIEKTDAGHLLYADLVAEKK